MANTYTQIYIQIIFTVGNRQNLIPRSRNDELQKYITGIVKKRNHKMLAINNEPDHFHIFIGLDPQMSISNLVKDITAISSKFINKRKWIVGKFAWQAGFGAFSYSRSQIDRVIKYIQNQQKHHKIKTFREEYVGLLNKFEIEYDEQYLFNWID